LQTREERKQRDNDFEGDKNLDHQKPIAYGPPQVLRLDCNNINKKNDQHSSCCLNKILSQRYRHD